MDFGLFLRWWKTRNGNEKGEMDRGDLGTLQTNCLILLLSKRIWLAFLMRHYLSLLFESMLYNGAKSRKCVKILTAKIPMHWKWYHSSHWSHWIMLVSSAVLQIQYTVCWELIASTWATTPFWALTWPEGSSPERSWLEPFAETAIAAAASYALVVCAVVSAGWLDSSFPLVLVLVYCICACCISM